MVTWLRNKLYDLDIKKSMTYEVPVIAVGNLSVGGTGKSPMVEYLIRLLRDKVHLATLSRGYKRETNGFQLVTINSLVKDVGDEPLQFKTKFCDIVVGVDGDRRNGIANLMNLRPKPSLILLDDAYQHRKVKASFYILLTPYDDLYCDDILLPTGNLREPRKGADRANIVVVTKCPGDITQEDRVRVAQKLRIKSNQILFFSTINYGNEIFNTSANRSLDSLKDVFFVLVTGIANPKPLIDYYTSIGLDFKHVRYPDHHNFTTKELSDINKHDLIITTEKDYVRLSPNLSSDKLWYQPIEVKFIEGKADFDARILENLKKAK